MFLSVLSGFSSSSLFLKTFGYSEKLLYSFFSYVLNSKSLHLRGIYPYKALITALFEEKELFTKWRVLSCFLDTNMSNSEWRSVQVFWTFACQRAEKASKCKWMFLKQQWKENIFLHTLKRPCYKDHDSKSPVARDSSAKLPEQEMRTGWQQWNWDSLRLHRDP